MIIILGLAVLVAAVTAALTAQAPPTGREQIPGLTSSLAAGSHRDRSRVTAPVRRDGAPQRYSLFRNDYAFLKK